RLQGMEWALLGERRVRRRLYADDSAFGGARLEDLVRLHPLRVPEPARAGMSDQDRPLACLDGVERRQIAAVRDVDGHSDLVHATHRRPTEIGQATVALLAKTRPEPVRFAVRDSHGPDAEAVEDRSEERRVGKEC